MSQKDGAGTFCLQGIFHVSDIQNYKHGNLYVMKEVQHIRDESCSGTVSTHLQVG